MMPDWPINLSRDAVNSYTWTTYPCTSLLLVFFYNILTIEGEAIMFWGNTGIWLAINTASYPSVLMVMDL
jgi:hypothetical protein